MSTSAIESQRGIVPEFTLTDRLRKAREVTGLSQAEFGREIDVSARTISNYENGTFKPKMLVLELWAFRTGVSLEWIVDGAGHEKTPSPDGDGVHVNEPPAGIEPATFSLQLVHFDQESIAA